MRLHSLIFPPKISFNVAKKISKELTEEPEVRHWTLNERVWIGYTLPNKKKTYTSKEIKFKGLPLVMVYEY